MKKFSYSEIIHTPIERVFDCVNNPENIKKWAKGVEEINFNSDYNPNNPVNATFTQKIKECGTKVNEYQGKILAYQKPEHFKVSVENHQFSITAEYRLNEVLEGTILDYKAEIVSKTTFSKLMGFLFGWLTHSILKQQIEALKELAETEEIELISAS